MLATRRVLVVLAAACLHLLVQAAPQPRAIWAEASVRAMSAAPKHIADARDQATAEAVRNALDMAARRQLGDETVAEDHAIVGLFLRLDGQKYVNRHILEKSRTEDGPRVRAWVTAWVDEEALGQALWAAIAQPRSVGVVVTGGPDMALSDVDDVRTHITSALIQAGLRVVSLDQAQQARRQQQLAALDRGDNRAARTIERELLINQLLRVRLQSRVNQNNAGIISALASADVDCIRTSDARMIFGDRVAEVKGFGLGPAQAISDACSKLAPGVAEYAAASLLPGRTPTGTIRIVSLRPLSDEAWETLGQSLQRSGLVTGVLPGNGGLSCATDLSIWRIAAYVHERPRLQVKSCGGGTIQVVTD